MLLYTDMLSEDQYYHFDNCELLRIVPDNFCVAMKPRKTISKGYFECPCCGGIAGFLRLNKNKVFNLEKHSKMQITYIKKTDTLYIRTEEGFWKIFKRDLNGYVLYHYNDFHRKKEFGEMMHGRFHHQRDVEQTLDIMSILQYIRKHDEAMRIIATDYRKLPRRTQQERYYYNQAAKKHKGREIKRIYQLFAEIEHGTDMKQLSIC